MLRAFLRLLLLFDGEGGLLYGFRNRGSYRPWIKPDFTEIAPVELADLCALGAPQ